MTVKKLIERLQNIVKEDASANEREVIFSSNKKIPDKRSRSGHRSEKEYSTVMYAASGKLGIKDKQYTEIVGDFFPL